MQRSRSSSRCAWPASRPRSASKATPPRQCSTLLAQLPVSYARGSTLSATRLLLLTTRLISLQPPNLAARSVRLPPCGVAWRHPSRAAASSTANLAICLHCTSSREIHSAVLHPAPATTARPAPSWLAAPAGSALAVCPRHPSADCVGVSPRSRHTLPSATILSHPSNKRASVPPLDASNNVFERPFHAAIQVWQSAPPCNCALHRLPDCPGFDEETHGQEVGAGFNGHANRGS